MESEACSCVSPGELEVSTESLLTNKEILINKMEDNICVLQLIKLDDILDHISSSITYSSKEVEFHISSYIKDVKSIKVKEEPLVTLVSAIKEEFKEDEKFEYDEVDYHGETNETMAQEGKAKQETDCQLTAPQTYQNLFVEKSESPLNKQICFPLVNIKDYIKDIPKMSDDKYLPEIVCEDGNIQSSFYKITEKLVAPVEMKVHVSQTSDENKLCHQHLYNNYSELLHARIHAARLKNYECKYCSATTSTRKMLQQHVKKVHTNIKYECYECKKVVFNKNYLRKHIDRVHKKCRNRECSKCYKMFYDMDGLNTHTRRVHKKAKNYACKKCVKTYFSIEDLKTHITELHQESTYTCNQCYKLFLKADDLQNHVDRVHPWIVEYDSDDSQSQELNSHSNVMHKQLKEFKCDQCHQIFLMAYHLKQHIDRIHKGIKMFECNDCHKMFFQLHSLKVHLNAVHKGIKEFKCYKCSKMFSQSGHMKEHINRVHNDIRRFMCNHCSHLFSQKDDLQKHIQRMHNQNTSFECNECHKLFFKKREILLHIIGKCTKG